MPARAREELRVGDGDADGGAETGRGYVRGERGGGVEGGRAGQGWVGGGHGGWSMMKSKLVG